MANSKFGKKLAVSLAVVACALIIGAQAHFVYIAASTQPDCVTHKKSGSENTQGYAAAKSSC